MDERLHDFALDRLWDEIVASPGGPVARRADVDPADELIIRQFQSYGALTPPDAVRERVRHAVLSNFDQHYPGQESAMNQTVALDVAGPATGPNGRTNAPPLSLPPFELPRRRLNSAIARAAAAVLIILTIVSGYFIFTGDDRPAVAPPSTPATPQATGESTQYRYGPERSGVAPDPGPLGQPVELWRFQAEGRVGTAAAVVGGSVFLGSEDDNVYAIDAATGAEIWRFLAGADVVTSPAVVAGTVYINSADAILFALDAATGEERWRFAGPRTTPAVSDGVVFTGSDDGNLYALDAATGAEVWQSPLGAAASGSTAVADEIVFVGSADVVLHAIDAATGEERWVFQAEGETVGTPAVVDGVVYQAVFGAGSLLYALDAATGQEVWRFGTDGGETIWVPAVAGATVYSGSDDGNLYALDAATGLERWRFPTDGAIDAAPTLAGDTIYLGNRAGVLYAVNAADGQERWRVTLDGEVTFGPTIADGVAYVGTHLGIVYAIEGTIDSETQVASLPAPMSPAATPAATPAGLGTPAAAGDAEFVWQIGGDDGLLDQPEDVAVAPDGTIWVADQDNEIKIFDPSGALLETWGTPGSGDGEFSFGDHAAVSLDASGNIYVLDQNGHRVQKFDRERNLLLAWGSAGTGNGQFVTASDIAVDPDGNVYVVDIGRRDVQKFDSEGRYLATIEGPDPDEPFGPRIGTDSAGNLYVPDETHVHQFTPDGAFIRSFGGDGSEPGALGAAIDVAVDAAGNVYVSDAGNHVIQVYDPTGRFLDTIGEFGPDPGQFVEAGPLAYDGEGHLYVVDFGNRRVQKLLVSPPLAPEATPAV